MPIKAYHRVTRIRYGDRAVLSNYEVSDGRGAAHACSPLLCFQRRLVMAVSEKTLFDLTLH